MANFPDQQAQNPFAEFKGVENKYDLWVKRDGTLIKANMFLKGLHHFVDIFYIRTVNPMDLKILGALPTEIKQDIKSVKDLSNLGTVIRQLQTPKTERIQRAAEAVLHQSTATPTPTPASTSAPAPIAAPTITAVDFPFRTSPELIAFNKEIVDLRVQIEALTHQLNTSPREKWPEIREEKQILLDRHTEITQEKVAFVKAAFPDNPVLAMAIPQTLKKGMQLSTAGSAGKIEGLKKNGIIFDPNRAPTGLDPKSKAKQFGVNEMGDRGIYFSAGRPAYFSSELPRGIGCELAEDLSGVSLMPVSELANAFGFSDVDINKAYGRLQEEFNFIQHDGPYPKNTEIVIMRNENQVVLKGEFKEEFLDNDGDVLELPIQVADTIHNSWKPK